MAYKPIQADDKPKLIAISIHALVVFSYGTLRIATGGGRKAHASKPEVTTSGESARPDKEIDGLSDEQLVADAIPNPSAGRDPFVADSALTSATPSVAQPGPVSDKPTSNALAKPKNRPSVIEALASNPPVALTFHANPATVNLTSGNLQPKPQQTASVPDLPICTLKRTLVDGDNPVAILEIGNERRFLHDGDAVADRFYVKSIHLDGITVAHRTKPTLMIRLRNGKPYLPQSGPAEQTK